MNKLKIEDLFELVLSANYMDIKELLDLTCGKVACIIRDKSVDQLRKDFNIKNDFAPAEEVRGGRGRRPPRRGGLSPHVCVAERPPAPI
jgi:hypothetical protein